MNMIPNKVIIWGKDGYNPLGLLRQLHDYADLYFVLVGGVKYCAVKSKFCKHLYKSRSYDDGLEWILRNFKDEKYKPVIITTGDLIAEYVDQQYDKIIVAPMTANMIGKVASGIADDVVSSTLIAATIPVGK